MVDTELELRPFKFEVNDNGEFKITMETIISKDQWNNIFRDNVDKPVTVEIQDY